MNLVAHALRGEGFDASEDGTGRGTPLGPMFLHVNKGRPAGRQSAHTEMVSVKPIVETLTTDGHAQSAVAVPVAFDTTQITSAANRSNPQPGDACHPLAAGAHVPCVAYSTKLHNTSSNQAGKFYEGYTVGLDANSPPPAVLTPIAFPERMSATQCASAENVSPSLGALNPTAVATQWAVRRLTPLEAERLMGFPDGHTGAPHKGKPAADGPRYKALGNSWAVNCARWIGERIEAVEAA